MKNFSTALICVIVALIFIPALAEATSVSDLTGAGATNTINNGANPQWWKWTGLTGIGWQLTSDTTAGSNSHAILNISLTGANATSNVGSYGITVSNEHSGTNSTNFGVVGEADNGTLHNYGITGQTSGINSGDAAVYAVAYGSSGATYGVYANDGSATGYAGYFDNARGGYAAAFMGGNVGIGTATPINLLDIGTGGGIHIASGVPGSTSMALYNNSGTLTWNGIALATGSSVSGTTNYIPVFTGSSSLGNSVIYQSGSNVGIGTATPQSLVHAYGGEVQVGSSSASCAAATGGAIRFSGSTLYYCDGTSTWQTVSTGSGSSQWTTSGSNIYYSTGNVGINTASPAAKLDVNGAADIRGAVTMGSPQTFIVGDDGGSLGGFLNETAALPLRFYTNGVEQMRLDSAGKLLIGYTSSQSACCLLQVNGTIGATSTSITSLSDKRLKTDIAPIGATLPIIMALNPVSFQFVKNHMTPAGAVLAAQQKAAGSSKSAAIQKPDVYNFPGGTQVGFTAQDVADAVKKTPYLSALVDVPADQNSDYYTLREGNMIPLLVKAMQEQQAQLAKDEAALNKDEATIAAMKAKLGM